MSEPPYSAFFYGTLLHPAILRRVIGHDGQHLQICPALLLVSHLAYKDELLHISCMYNMAYDSWRDFY